MTFPLIPTRISVKLCLLLLASACFPHTAISQQPRTVSSTIGTVHIFPTAGTILASANPHLLGVSAFALQHSSGLIALITVIATLITAIGGLIAATRKGNR